MLITEQTLYMLTFYCVYSNVISVLTCQDICSIWGFKKLGQSELKVNSILTQFRRRWDGIVLQVCAGFCVQAVAASIFPLEGDKSAVTAPVAAEQIYLVLQVVMRNIWTFLCFYMQFEFLIQVQVQNWTLGLSETVLLNNFVTPYFVTTTSEAAYDLPLYCMCYLCCFCPWLDLNKGHTISLTTL